MQVSPRSGFTLVELAIVLVIIALLVGGVMVGQDLIRAGEINATVSQMMKYDTAASTFRERYRGFPGDLRNPEKYPIASTGADGSIGRANADGVIQPGACTSANGYGGESAIFWTHLNQANLIPDAANAITDYGATAALTITDDHMPAARIGNNNRFHVTSVAGRNFYVIANFRSTTAATCALATSDAMTPLTAYQLDSKIDDAIAMTGIMVSVLDGGIPTIVSGGSAVPDNVGSDDCYNSTTGAYAMETEGLANALQCQLRVRTSF